MLQFAKFSFQSVNVWRRKRKKRNRHFQSVTVLVGTLCELLRSGFSDTNRLPRVSFPRIVRVGVSV